MRKHVYVRTDTVATLVGWQVNKVNSLNSPFQFPIEDEKDVYILYIPDKKETHHYDFPIKISF